MAMMDPNNWTAQEHSMHQAGQDEFQQFLDMGDMPNLGGDGMQFDFQGFSAPNGTTMMHNHSAHDAIDTQMGGTETPNAATGSNMGLPHHMTPMTSGPALAAIPSQLMPAHHGNASDAISDLEAQIQFLQHQKLQQQQRQLEEQQRRFAEQQAAFFAQQQSMVPPTPQSLEIQAATQYYTQGDQPPHHSQGMFDRYHRLKEQQDMAFTPLVSPAVTPLDAHFPVDTQFTVPGAYFSPLTSPALHAQNETHLSFGQGQGSTNTTNSPQEMDLENSGPPSVPVDLSKKVRKGNVSKARKGVRQSPIVKPQRRKTASTPVMNAQILSELAESAAERTESTTAKPTSASGTSTEDSENASVSPEALSDMPPPPLPQPRSARQSPHVQAHQTAVHPLPASLNGMASPATPATLFRISPKGKSTDITNPGQVASEHIETFELPESASFPKPQLPQLNTQTDSTSPPEVETAKVVTLQPLPSPVFPKPSPRLAPSIDSPQIAPKGAATPNPRKTPMLAPRGSKKRGSVSSVAVSPALRPKISPNIKPLLPGTPGLSAEDTASRLLASKSNYQNIIEGNTVPGVSYPSELSTNLTSKRTSHKIAEQGRRNRINSALQEIATLLPGKMAKHIANDEGDSPEGDKKDGKPSSTPNSKASTVEMAIIYIKQLQQEIADANKRAEAAEKKLAGSAEAS
ncbi:putative Helix-loop-helix DNA-binding domain-containing protein [Seiridium cardinale]|uniref:Helix-loop-helix DNA-binding domain-containing protein n=1 Tax=Seiridium cardinale TaxID=138064 RepID=A0ABR2XA61_9PEZI